jgi:hypothetical protein
MRKIVIEVPDDCLECRCRIIHEDGTRECPFQIMSIGDRVPVKACRDAEVSQ